MQIINENNNSDDSLSNADEEYEQGTANDDVDDDDVDVGVVVGMGLDVDADMGVGTVAEEVMGVVPRAVDGAVMGVGVIKTTNPTTSRKITEASSGKFVKKLTQIPIDKHLQEHLGDLKERSTAWESFTSAMDVPKKILKVG